MASIWSFRHATLCASRLRSTELCHARAAGHQCGVQTAAPIAKSGVGRAKDRQTLLRLADNPDRLPGVPVLVCETLDIVERQRIDRLLVK